MAQYPAFIDLASLDGTTGFRIDGIGGYDNSGRSVASAGDVNGDGFDDFIIGAAEADASGVGQAGQSYVVLAMDFLVGGAGADTFIFQNLIERIRRPIARPHIRFFVGRRH